MPGEERRSVELFVADLARKPRLTTPPPLRFRKQVTRSGKQRWFVLEVGKWSGKDGGKRLL